jgi:hypothetical protein
MCVVDGGVDDVVPGLVDGGLQRWKRRKVKGGNVGKLEN